MKKYTIRPVLTEEDLADILDAYNFYQEHGDYIHSKTFCKIWKCKNNIEIQKVMDGNENE